MGDVSRQAWSFFLTCEEQGYFVLDDVLSALPYDRAHFERGAGRIPWEDWAALIDRVGELLGDDARVEAAGRAALTPTFTGRLHAVVPFLSDPLDVYRIGWRWLAPYLFRNLSFHVEERGERRVEVTMAIPAPFRACPTWTRMAVGTAAAAPRLLDLPDARVVSEEVSPRSVRVLLEVPPPRAGGLGADGRAAARRAGGVGRSRHCRRPRTRPPDHSPRRPPRRRARARRHRSPHRSRLARPAAQRTGTPPRAAHMIRTPSFIDLKVSSLSK